MRAGDSRFGRRCRGIAVAPISPTPPRPPRPHSRLEIHHGAPHHLTQYPPRLRRRLVGGPPKPARRHPPALLLLSWRGLLFPQTQRCRDHRCPLRSTVPSTLLFGWCSDRRRPHPPALPRPSYSPAFSRHRPACAERTTRPAPIDRK